MTRVLAGAATLLATAVVAAPASALTFGPTIDLPNQYVFSDDDPAPLVAVNASGDAVTAGFTGDGDAPRSPVWLLSGGRVTRKLARTAAYGPDAAAISPQGTALLSWVGGGDSVRRFLLIPRGGQPTRTQKLRRPALALFPAALPDGSFLLIGSEDGPVRATRVGRTGRQGTPKTLGATLLKVAADPGGRVIAAVRDSAGVSVWTFTPSGGFRKRALPRATRIGAVSTAAGAFLWTARDPSGASAVHVLRAGVDHAVPVSSYLQPWILDAAGRAVLFRAEAKKTITGQAATDTALGPATTLGEPNPLYDGPHAVAWHGGAAALWIDDPDIKGATETGGTFRPDDAPARGKRALAVQLVAAGDVVVAAWSGINHQRQLAFGRP